MDALAVQPAASFARLRRRIEASLRRMSSRQLALYSGTLAAFLAVLAKFGPRLRTRFLCLMLNLDQPLPGKVKKVGTIGIPAAQPGAYLSTSIYAREGEKSPTVIVRTPYGKYLLEFMGNVLGAQGFNVVMQDTRGRFDSTGHQTFAAFEDEDGVATIDWLGKQNYDWYDPERVTMFGISYLGIVQWALVAGLRRRQVAEGGTGGHGTASTPKLAAMTPLFAASRVHDVFFCGNTFRLDFYVRYMHFMINVNSRFDHFKMPGVLFTFELLLLYYQRQCLSAKQLHQKVGMPRMFKYNPRQQSRFWQNRDYSDGIPAAPPTLVITGWHDIMLESSLRDYQSLVAVHGKGHSRLVIGPWHHLESIYLPVFRQNFRESIEFLREKTGVTPPKPENDELPVRLWIMDKRAAGGGWKNFSAWPPKEVQDEVMVLGPGSLSEAKTANEVDNGGATLLKHDPKDPAPDLGGSTFHLWLPFLAGERKQNALHSHSDVLHFDSRPLPTDLTIVGCAQLRLTIRTSRPHFDIFARLCDVHPSGRSYNVCDAVLRHHEPSARASSHQEVHSIVAPDMKRAAMGEKHAHTQVVEVCLRFAGTAKCFRAGHRLRLILAGGRYPQHANNFGDREQQVEEDPLEVEPYMLEILHTKRTPSSLKLPVLEVDDDNTPRKSRCFEALSAERERMPKSCDKKSPSNRQRQASAMMDSLRRIRSDFLLA
eukprot:TRINITY_DN27663_c1_g1_i2.p1 TRINITY_DN27663_c1_g1~~TRINITY_DN27663_c1_g1_i2.p1  ORF type:complete len:709 (-),score=147.86 TRINITY_DN27663_c1_g1_i2:115-2241(-)